MREVREREPLLLKLLGESWVEFSRACVRVSAQDGEWLERLVKFMSKCTWEGREHADLPASECVDQEGREQTIKLLTALFKNRDDGRALSPAVELAEELARRGDKIAQEIVSGFFEEAPRLRQQGELREEMVPVGGRRVSLRRRWDSCARRHDPHGPLSDDQRRLRMHGPRT